MANSRLPIPSLFVGPPSSNVSSTSLLHNPSKSSSTVVPSSTLVQQKWRRYQQHRGRNTSNSGLETATATGERPSDSPFTPDRIHCPLSPQSRRDHDYDDDYMDDEDFMALGSSSSTSRADALWAEMQKTLEEVETGPWSGAQVRGRERQNDALEQLRAAQINLAKAWARSKAEEGREEHLKDGIDELAEGTLPSQDHSAREQPQGSRLGFLEEDTEHDILMARMQREKNNKYFQTVNAGVLNVVSKLEDVAKAMRDVEAESMDIWG